MSSLVEALTVGLPELLLGLGLVATVVLALFRRRTPGLLTGLLTLLGVGALGLGVYTAHARLDLLPVQLELLPVRLLAGQVATSRAQAASAGWLVMLLVAVAALVAPRPPDGSPRGRVVLPFVLPALLGLLDPLAAVAAGVLLVCALAWHRSGHRRAALGVVAATLAVAFAAEHAWHDALVLADRDELQRWPWLLGVRWLAWTAAAASTVGVVALTRWPFPALLGLVWLGVLPAAVRSASWAPSLQPDVPLVPMPTGIAARVVGGCLRDPASPAAPGRPFGPRSEVHRLMGCDPGGDTVWLGRPDAPAEALLTAPVDRVWLATSLGDAPAAWRPWAVGRWELPVLRRGSEGPGQPVVDAHVYLPAGVDLGDLPDAARVDLLIEPAGRRIADVLELCDRALQRRPRGLRCGLAASP